MPTRTISITEDAYLKLKSLKSSEKESFSDVILKYYPARKKLSAVLAEIGLNQDLADSIDKASIEMRQAKMRGVEL
ncbi:MAG TPA: antitoxin VapB family protein [Methanothrix sp.]|nr:antitoxin VapB family protein [Methanothrix sp.]